MIAEIATSALLNLSLWVLIIFALIVWGTTRHHRRSRWVGIALVILTWLMQTRVCADLIMAPLEDAYAFPSLQTMQTQGVSEVVVLTGGGYPVDDQSLSSGLPHASLVRFVAGVELCRQIGSRCRITFSGSSGAVDQLATAQVMEQLARRLVPDLNAQSESKSNNTAEHPGNVKKLVGENRFVLVTSAYHMPRSMLVFERAGMHPIPYSVDRYVVGEYDASAWLPFAGNLTTIQIALHEYVGLLWYSFVPGQS